MEEIFNQWISKKPNYHKLTVKEAHNKIRNNMTSCLNNLYEEKNEMELLKGDLTVFYDNVIINNSNNNIKSIDISESEDFYKNIYKEINNMRFNRN